MCMSSKSWSFVCLFWPYSGLYLTNAVGIFKHIVSLYCSPFLHQYFSFLFLSCPLFFVIDTGVGQKTSQSQFLGMPVTDHLEHWLRTWLCQIKCYPKSARVSWQAWLSYPLEDCLGTPFPVPFVILCMILFSNELFLLEF